MSCKVAKLALPMTRLSTIRPATATATGWASSASRRKSLGYARPCSRSARSLARRSAMIWFSSPAVGCVSPGSLTSHSLLQTRGDEVVEVTVEDCLRIADLDIRAQVLYPRLVEDVGADLVAPANVGLGVFEL